MIESLQPTPVVAKVGLAICLNLSSVIGDGKIAAPMKVTWHSYHVMHDGKLNVVGDENVYRLQDANAAQLPEDKLLVESLATALQIWARTKGL